MKNKQKLFRTFRTLSDYRPTQIAKLESKYKATLLSEPEFLVQAKRLHADVYLERRYIQPDDVIDGIIHDITDPYAQHSTYFGVIDERTSKVVAVARQIASSKQNILPMIDHVIGKKEYMHIHHDQMVEISAFVKKRGVDSRVVLLLFRAMIVHSRKMNHRYWLLSVDTHVYRRLKTLFGPVMKRVGKPTFYLGSEVIPVEIDISHASRRLARSYRFSAPPWRTVRKFVYESTLDPDNSSKTRFKTWLWNGYARHYDALLQFYPYRHLVSHLVESVDTRPRSILDLGCGTGNVSIALAAKFPSAKIDAVDESDAMLKVFTNKYQDSSLHIFHMHLIDFLYDKNKKYDLIVMNNVLYTLENQSEVIKLLQKRITDNGRILIANPTTASSWPLLREHVQNTPFHQLIPKGLVMVFFYDTLLSTLGTAGSYHFATPRQLRRWITAAKLEVIGTVQRCYGGHQRGIDAVVTVKKSSGQL